MVHDSVHIYSFLNERSADLLRVNKILRSGKQDNDSKAAAASELRGISSTSAPYRRTGSFKPYRTSRRIKIQRSQQKRKREDDEASSASASKLMEPNAKRRKKAVQPLTRKQKRGLLAKQGRSDWLSTHVWHAKRMSMSREFGPPMAAYHRSRGITRKLSDALATRAVVHDSSYLKPIELRGAAAALASLLHQVTDPAGEFLNTREESEGEEGESCDSKSDKESDAADDESKSMREVHAMLYRRGAFPAACIGPCVVSLIPTASQGRGRGRAANKCVWLWLHPSIYAPVFSELKAAAAAVAEEEEQWGRDNMDAGNRGSSDSGSDSSGKDVATNRAKQRVSVEHVIDPPARFSVRGTHALQVVQQLLQPNADTAGKANAGSDSVGEFYMELQGVSPRAVKSLWRDGYSLAFDAKGLLSMSGRTAATAAVPEKRKKGKKKALSWPDPAVQHSHLRWLSDVSTRLQTNKTAVTEQDINSHRSRQRHSLFSISDESTAFADAGSGDHSALTSSPQLAEKANEVRVPPIPVVVIKCNESSAMAKYFVPAMLQKKHTLAGFDILLPRCHAKRVWSDVQLQTQVIGEVESKSLAICEEGESKGKGKRQAAILAVGYREMDFLRLQAGIPSFPRDYPETNAGSEYWIRQLETREDSESRVTRRKKQSIVSWKIPNWDLMRNSGDDSNSTGLHEFVVARNSRYSDSFRRPAPAEADGLQALPALPKMPFPTCVSVLIVPVARGVPVDGAKIMLPTVEDYELYKWHEENKSTVDSKIGRANGAWLGYPSTDGVKRQVIGAITSGSSREGKGRDRGTTSPCDKRFAIGLCRVDLLHAAQSLSHQRGAAREKTMVLFCNPERRAGCSDASADGWVRPALCHISSIEF